MSASSAGRSNLDGRIRAALDAGSVVLLQAPRGYGKTTSLRSALLDGARPVAWYETAPWHRSRRRTRAIAKAIRLGISEPDESP